MALDPDRIRVRAAMETATAPAMAAEKAPARGMDPAAQMEAVTGTARAALARAVMGTAMASATAAEMGTTKRVVVGMVASPDLNTKATTTPRQYGGELSFCLRLEILLLLCHNIITSFCFCQAFLGSIL
jgi:hypothetical protein